MSKNANLPPHERETPASTPDKSRLSRFSRADRNAWHAGTPAESWSAGGQPAPPVHDATQPDIGPGIGSNTGNEPRGEPGTAQPPAAVPRGFDLPPPVSHAGQDAYREALHQYFNPRSEPGLASPSEEVPPPPDVDFPPEPFPEPAPPQQPRLETRRKPRERASVTLPVLQAQDKPEPAAARLRRAGGIAARKAGAGLNFAALKAAAGIKAASRASARFVRRRTRKGQFSNDYTNALIWLHTRLFDRKVERLFFHPTVDPERYPPLKLHLRRRLSGLFRRRKDHAPRPVPAPPPADDLTTPVEPVFYDGPVPRLVFRWCMAALPPDLKSFAFTDFRSGRGRALLLAAGYNFEKIIGYEYDDQRFDDLQMNIAQYPRSLMTCRNIECIRGDRDGLAIPPQPAVLYFAKASREEFLPVIMRHVEASYRLHPRRMYVILEDAGEDLELGCKDMLYPIEPEGREVWLLKLLSPVKMRIYRTLV